MTQILICISLFFSFPWSAGFLAKMPGQATESALPLPPNYQVAAVRYGKRRSPSTGMTETHFGVLLVNQFDRSSLILTFVPGSSQPALQISRTGPQRFTDFQMVDFTGTSDHVIVGISGKNQDPNQIDIDPAFEAFDPRTGQPVLGRTPIDFDRQKAVFAPSSCNAQQPCTPNTKIDVDGAYITKVGGREVMAIVPQASFLACCFRSDTLDPFVYFLSSPPGSSAPQSKAVRVPNANGNPIERSMVTFSDLGTGRKKMVVVSKAVVFTFDMATQSLERVRQFSDPTGNLNSINNSNDVPDHPNVKTCDPLRDSQSQCTAQGRRYGQIRILNVAGGQRLVVAAQSVSGGIPPQGLVPLYTVYGNPLGDLVPGRDSSFLAPIDQWAGATLSCNDPSTPNTPKCLDPFNTHPYRTHYRYFDRAKKKRTLGLLTFANGKSLFRGTPFNGIDLLGDRDAFGNPVPSILVSSADNTFQPSNTGFAIVRADTGRTRFQKPSGDTQPGAIAFDLVPASDPSQPARILAWGDLSGKTSYEQGRFQVYLIDRVARDVRLVPNMSLDEEPVLLDAGTLNRAPEGLAVEGGEAAVFNAVIKSNGRKAMLTFPRSNPPTIRARLVNAYDVDDFTPRLAGADLEGSLLAVAEPGELPLDAPGTAGSSTLIILSGNSIIFKGVASANGAWQLVRGSLLGQNVTAPTLSVNPTGLSFTATQNGANPASQVVNVNSAGGTVNYSASSNASWLTVSQISAVTPSSITASVNIAGLTPSTYNALITVSSGGASNSPVIVPVTLTVTSCALASITSISPVSGSAGTVVTIFGSNLGNATAVDFNGAPAFFSVVVDNLTGQISLRAVVPTGATTGPVHVANSCGTATGPTFTVPSSGCNLPTIASFSPTRAGVGATVTITGANFTVVQAVSFNGALANFAVDSTTAIRTTVPQGVTTGPIRVTTSCGSVTSIGNFIPLLVVQPPAGPVINDFNPRSGPVGTSVIITGAGFDSSAVVTFNGVTASRVINSSGQITATVPSGATTGPITVDALTGSATSAASFTVTQSGGGGSVPAAPTNLVAFGGFSSIDVSWDDNSSNEDGFKLERRIGAGAFTQITVLGPNARAYTDFSVSPSLTFTYRVRAFNAAGDSAYSNAAGARPLRETGFNGGTTGDTGSTGKAND